MKMAMEDDRRLPETWPQMESIDAKDVAMKLAEEVETESSGSSEAETESPTSVGRWEAAAAVPSGGAAKERVHSQVLRIRKEELCVLGEDKAAKYCCGHDDRRYLHRHRLNLLLVSRPILPFSPLSGKVSSFKAVQ